MHTIPDKQWIQERLDQAVSLMIHEMDNRFGEVNARLERMDAYTRVLAEMAELKRWLDRLEGKGD